MTEIDSQGRLNLSMRDLMENRKTQILIMKKVADAVTDEIADPMPVAAGLKMLQTRRTGDRRDRRYSSDREADSGRKSSSRRERSNLEIKEIFEFFCI